MPKNNAPYLPTKKIVPATIEKHELIMTSSPLPAAEELQKYELICPGAAERILRLLESCFY